MITPLINKLLGVVAVLSIVGMGLAGYLTYMHYAPEAGSFCTVSETINCDIVNKSPWSVFDLGFVEIPVAIPGFLTYLILGAVSMMLIKKVKFQKLHSLLRAGNVMLLLRWFSVFAFLFSLYLTYIEAFVLYAWCMLCVSQQIVIAVIMLIFYYIKHLINKNKKDSGVCEFC